jgi:hypothetical protein
MLSDSSSVTRMGAPPAAGISHTLLVARFPKSWLFTNCRLPDTQASQRPSGDQVQEWLREPARPSRAAVQAPYVDRVAEGIRGRAPVGDQVPSAHVPCSTAG